MLCKNAIKYDDGRHKYLICTKNGNPCGFFRWCVIDGCLKMLPEYKNCRLLNS